MPKKKHSAVTAAAKKKKEQDKKGRLWRLDDGVTFSSLSRWLECPEQFSLAYIEGKTPKRISEPLEFGSVFHLALEYQFKASPNEVINRVASAYRDWRRPTLTNSAEKDALEKILGLAAVTFRS